MERLLRHRLCVGLAEGALAAGDVGTVAALSPLEQWENTMSGWLTTVRGMIIKNPRTLTWYWAYDATIYAAWNAGYVIPVLGTKDDAPRWRLSAKGLRRLTALHVLKTLRGGAA